jgi:lipid-A-disaccharide synthase-like uncharacterized protein
MKLSFDGWVVFGFLAQFVFFLRFVVQWWASEKEKKSVVPMSFWYLSIIGSVMILVYAIRRQDIVFITAQFLALFIYLRNIMLHKKEHSA